MREEEASEGKGRGERSGLVLAETLQRGRRERRGTGAEDVHVEHGAARATLPCGWGEERRRLGEMRGGG